MYKSLLLFFFNIISRSFVLLPLSLVIYLLSFIPKIQGSEVLSNTMKQGAKNSLLSIVRTKQ